jgi:5-methylcytosine-specific restriction endonuclease McrA
MEQTSPHTDRDWLYKKYHIEQLGLPEIGAIVKRDAKTIFYWMRKHKIPTRPRGSDQRQWLRVGNTLRLGMKASEEAIRNTRAATIRRGQLPYLKNGVHYNKGKRGAVVWNWRGGVTPERQTFYRSDEWKAIVRSIWQRDDAICQRCGLDSRTIDKTKTRPFHIHHIVSFAVRALRMEPTNLILLCHDCHMWVHSKQNLNGDFLDKTREAAELAS